METGELTGFYERRTIQGRRNERMISSSRVIGEWTEKSFKSDEYVIKHQLIGYIAPGTQTRLRTI